MVQLGGGIWRHGRFGGDFVVNIDDSSGSRRSEVFDFPNVSGVQLLAEFPTSCA